MVEGLVSKWQFLDDHVAHRHNTRFGPIFCKLASVLYKMLSSHDSPEQLRAHIWMAVLFACRPLQGEMQMFVRAMSITVMRVECKPFFSLGVLLSRPRWMCNFWIVYIWI